MERAGAHRCGFVAVVGRPNVGKSTLINAVVGKKVTIVSPKPQTTRHRILGVRSDSDRQLILVDTPGLHANAGKAMNRMMNRTAVSAFVDADVVLFLVEAGRWTADDEHALKRLQAAKSKAATFAVLNKIDTLKNKSDLLGNIAEMAERHAFAEIVPISARRGDNVDRLLDTVATYLPESPPLFTPDMLTDRGDLFFAAEVIREKLTLALRDELPYGLTVQIERFDDRGEQIELDAIVWVERDSQKGIVIGKGGAVLKRVGESARKDLLRHFDRRVHLELWVKVKKNWADSEADLRKLGYEGDGKHLQS